MGVEEQDYLARALLSTGCIQFMDGEPFRLPSGWASPVYVDCRRIISFPEVRRWVVQAWVNQYRLVQPVSSITAGEASGIALGAWLAGELGLPLHFVRKGRLAAKATQFVGAPRAGESTLLVDDVLAAGHSKVRFCETIHAAGLRVHNAFVVFDYGTFPTAELLANHGVQVAALVSWKDVRRCIERSVANVSQTAVDLLDEFLEDPAAWSEANGGISSPLESSPYELY